MSVVRRLQVRFDGLHVNILMFHQDWSNTRNASVKQRKAQGFNVVHVIFTQNAVSKYEELKFNTVYFWVR